MEEEGTNRYEGKCQALAQIFKVQKHTSKTKNIFYYRKLSETISCQVYGNVETDEKSKTKL